METIIITSGGFVTQVNKMTVNSILYNLAIETILKALLGNRPWTRPSFFSIQTNISSLYHKAQMRKLFNF